MKQLSDREIGYLAGFFDGEGCVSIDQHLHEKRGIAGLRTFSINVRISNINLEVLQWIQSMVGGHIYEHAEGGRRHNGRNRPTWQIYLSGKPAKRLFEMIEPFVIVKRQQIALAMEFFQLQAKRVPQARAALWERMRKLNSRLVANKTACSAASVTSSAMKMEVEI